MPSVERKSDRFERSKTGTGTPSVTTNGQDYRRLATNFLHVAKLNLFLIPCQFVLVICVNTYPWLKRQKPFWTMSKIVCLLVV